MLVSVFNVYVYFHVPLGFASHDHLALASPLISVARAVGGDGADSSVGAAGVNSEREFVGNCNIINLIIK